MQCPKCGGEAYLVDEELVKVMENTDPMKVIAKATYVCRSCGDRFSRLAVENIDAKKAEPQTRPEGVYSGQTYGSAQKARAQQDDAIDQLRFF
jgi:phage terminase large subunit GpA-like protein